MKEAGRLQTAIELISSIAASDRPADGAMTAFFRQRRYIGSSDRRDVSERVWRILRTWARSAWRVRRIIGRPRAAAAEERHAVTPRQRMIVDLVVAQKLSLVRLQALFSGDSFAPARLDAREEELACRLEEQTFDDPAQPLWVRGEVPPWAIERLKPLYGETLPALLEVMRDPAPVDLRVNTLKTNRETALIALRDEGIGAEPTRWSPFGLRLDARVDLASAQAFKSGLVEVQDEGSQLIAVMTGAAPGHAVCDFCAGAGGKTLALSAMMANRGRLVACDVSEGRIRRSGVRLKRAGAGNVARRTLDGENDKWIKRASGTFDRVLIDVPCSGTGTWRRNPDAKWRTHEAGLARLIDLQCRILRSAARLVKAGGRLTYATCSLLPEENEMQIEHFLAEHAAFRLMSVAEASGATLPFSGAMLRLDPLTHGTDGFFVATLEKAS